MTTKIFCVYDAKAQCHRFPFFQPSTGQAVRMFGAMANDPQSEIGKYSQDFSLYECGVWDDQTGEVSRIAPVNLGLAANFVAPMEVTNA